jgi:hypothetical protein
MQAQAQAHSPHTSPFIVTLAWLAVGVPLLWGVVQTIAKAMVLFH